MDLAGGGGPGQAGKAMLSEAEAQAVERWATSLEARVAALERRSARYDEVLSLVHEMLPILTYCMHYHGSATPIGRRIRATLAKARAMRLLEPS